MSCAFAVQLGIVAGQPGGNLANNVVALLPYRGEVRRAGISDHASCLAARRQNFKQLAPLVGRNTLVGRTMQDQQRRGYIFRVHGGGKDEECVGVLVGPAGVIIDLLHVAGPDEKVSQSVMPAPSMAAL